MIHLTEAWLEKKQSLQLKHMNRNKVWKEPQVSKYMPSTSLFFLRQINLLSPIRFKKKNIFRFKKTCWVQENQTRNGCLKSMGEGAHQLPSLDWQKPRDWRHYDIAAGIRIEQADIYLQRAIQEEKKKKTPTCTRPHFDRCHQLGNSSSDLQ